MSLEKQSTPEVQLDATTKQLRQDILGGIAHLEAKDYEMVAEAVELALKLHADQKERPDGPYIHHVLRVADRVVNKLGATDAHMVVAALLHDSVEDLSKKLAEQMGSYDADKEQETALAVITNLFGEESSRIVKGLTNPPDTLVASKEELNARYATHVMEAIEDPKIMLIKISDFMDNGFNLMAIENIEQRKKLATKYLPLYQIFIQRLEKPDTSIADKQALIQSFRDKQEEAKEILRSDKSV